MSDFTPAPHYSPPPVDGRQSEVASAVQRGTCRLLRDMGFAVLPEFTLATGRRADVMALAPSGEIWIVEIKSSPTDFYVDQKWGEYRDYCDQFFFSVPLALDQTILPPDAGVMVGDQFGAEIIRSGAAQPLVAARRKAVTLSFARSAALRLHGLWDPG